MNSALDKHVVLKEYFGFAGFRTGQEDVIDSLLGGRDAVGIMPTGAGKSLCFQIPSLLFEGVSLVGSPLISLMNDQVGSLRQSGVEAAFLNSTLTLPQMRTVLRNARAGKYSLLYVAPERLEAEDFLEFAHDASIPFVAVDEAHARVGAALFGGVGSAPGLATPEAVGAAALGAVGESAGVGAAVAVGAAQFAGVGAAAGSSVVLSEATAIASGVGAAAGGAAAANAGAGCGATSPRMASINASSSGNCG